MQIELLLILHTGGGYQTVMTAIDGFLRYLFAYQLNEATAASVAKVILDIMTKQSNLSATLITDSLNYFNFCSGNHTYFAKNAQLCYD